MNKFTPNKVYQGLKPIKSVLPKEIRKLSKSQKNLFDELKEKWSIVVGAEIASRCSPEKIKSGTNQEKKNTIFERPETSYFGH